MVKLEVHLLAHPRSPAVLLRLAGSQLPLHHLTKPLSHPRFLPTQVEVSSLQELHPHLLLNLAHLRPSLLQRTLPPPLRTLRPLLPKTTRTAPLLSMGTAHLAPTTVQWSALAQSNSVSAIAAAPSLRISLLVWPVPMELLSPPPSDTSTSLVATCTDASVPPTSYKRNVVHHHIHHQRLHFIHTPLHLFGVGGNYRFGYLDSSDFVGYRVKDRNFHLVHISRVFGKGF
jgi:hypothetical protein